MDLAKLLFRLVLGRRAPRHRGTIGVPGCRERLVIRRDRYGVPYIEAACDEDAWFGLGFCHAQDRAGQLELTLRTVRGTLAEVVGPDALPVDRLVRRLGCRLAAQGQLEAVESGTRTQIEAYARGVNAGLTAGSTRRAHELVLLGVQPTPWEAADVQALLGILCFALASNWDLELLRLRLLELDGPEALHALDTRYPAGNPVTAPPGRTAGAAAERLAGDLEALTHVFGSLGGSNAWVVAGSRTRTGRPMLANDPHLNPAAPCPWYLARLSTPSWSAAGASFVGIPSIAAGHNGFAAWGATAASADNTDLFLEEIGPDGRSVRQGADFVPCPVRREVICVKGQPPVTEDVVVTPRGPLLGPALEGESRALSIAATWLQPRPYVGLLGMHKARSYEDFLGMFQDADSTATTCVVYADETGTIGWQFASSIPRRRRGNGTLPQPGWDPDAGWLDGVVSHADMPHCRDPESGFLATANNQPVPEDHTGPYLGADWQDGYRAAAISRALSQRRDWDVADHQALQTDTGSLAWEEIRAAVLDLVVAPGISAQALDALRSWDGRVAEGSVGATVFELFLVELARRVAAVHAPNASSWALGKGFTRLLPANMVICRRQSHLIELVKAQPEGFLPRPWPDEMAAALSRVAADLQRRHGAPGRWQWGRVRPLTLAHPFGEKRPLNRVFNIGPLPGRGDAGTICQGTLDFNQPTLNQLGVPNLRMVIDVGDWDRSRFVLLGGQSGNPLSAQWDDLVPLWLRGEGIPIHWSPEAVAAATPDVLTLLPA